MATENLSVMSLLVLLQISVKSIWSESGKVPHGPIFSVGLFAIFSTKIKNIQFD